MTQFLKNTWKTTALTLGTGLGVGFIPFAPGTFGSVWGPLLVWSWQTLAMPMPISILAALAFVLVGIPICDHAQVALGRHDPGSVVFDEIAAFPVVFLATPVDLTTGILGFLWFRVFDISKPWPCKNLEKLPGGIGVMADDLAAAVYAAIALWLTVQLLGI